MDTPAKTTIKVSPGTRDALQAMKGTDSYDHLLERLLSLVPEGDDEGTFTPEFRRSLLDGLLHEGPRLTFDQMKAEFGLP